MDRFWYTLTKGAYATHGETYTNARDFIWWAKGGKLYGKSPERIAFLRKIVANAPQDDLEVYKDTAEEGKAVRVGGKYFLFYFGARQPAERWLILPNDKKYTIDIIDAWDMTIKALEGYYSARTLIKLPAKPYTAVRAILVE